MEVWRAVKRCLPLSNANAPAGFAARIWMKIKTADARDHSAGAATGMSECEL